MPLLTDNLKNWKQMAGRYELKEVLGEGGMGVVYRGLDTRTNVYVAIKTLRDMDAASLEMFRDEWAELAKLEHPNIVGVRDVDEIEEGGVRKPCFIMPLLQGETLASLIKSGSPRLTVEFVVNVISQVCKGLQAAHDKELIHRDLKPSNIMIGSDDTPRIIDFGLVHRTGTKSVTGLKGTWQYMAPEQVEGKPPSRRTDIFSLGVVAYEALTGMQPFKRNKLDDTVDAIRHSIPQAVSEKNPKVPEAVSKAVHVAMAKDPKHRYASAREFAETLQKAFAGHYIERFDPARIQPRIERAKKAFASGDLELASDILNRLESEGNLAPEITLLRQQMVESNKQKKMRQLLEAAQTRLEQEEYLLALEKVSEVLEIDPQHHEAQSMRRKIEGHISEQEISTRLGLARQYLEHYDFQEARRAVKGVLQLKYDDPSAAKLLAEIEAAEKEANEVRDEKQRLYSSALSAQQNGEISSAYSKIGQVIALSRNVPGASIPEKDKVYQALYNDVRSERDNIEAAYEEGTHQLSEKNFEKALGICDGILYKYPKNAKFSALRLKIEHAQRQDLSTALADVARAVDSEPNLDRKVGILEEACKRYPNEAQFQKQYTLARDSRDLAASIVSKARAYEEQKQFIEAIGQWKILSNIHPQYPGLEFEISQLELQRDKQAHDDKRARLIAKIDRALENSTYEDAVKLCKEGLLLFPGDQELAALARVAQQGVDRNLQATRLLEEAKESRAGGNWDQALALVRRALELDKRSILVRNTLVSWLVERSQMLLPADWAGAETLAIEADGLDPEHPFVKRLLATIEKARSDDFADDHITKARGLQGENIKKALEVINIALRKYPEHERLLQTKQSLDQQEASQFDKPTQLKPVLTGQEDTVLYPPQPAPNRIAPPQPAKPAEPKAPGMLEKVQEYFRKTNFGEMAKTAWFRGVALGLGAAVVVLGLVALWINRPGNPPPPPPPPETVKFKLVVTPADADVTIDGNPTNNRDLNLKKDSVHKVTVSRPGFTTVQIDKVADGKEWAFGLLPEKLKVNLAIGDNSAKVLWDGNQENGVSNGNWNSEYSLSGTPTVHELTVMGKAGTLFALKIKAAAGQMPEVQPFTADGLAVGASLGPDAILYGGVRPSTVTVSGKPKQEIPPGGLKVKIDDAPNGFPVMVGKQEITLLIAPGSAPTLDISQNAPPNKIIARVTSNKNSTLVVDNSPIAGRSGVFTWAMKPGVYRAKLSASGMQDYEFTIKATKGASYSTQHMLIPIVAKHATLIVEGIPGATVLVDGNGMGQIEANGRFSAKVEASDHTVICKKPEYESKDFGNQHFNPGSSVSLKYMPEKLVGYVQFTLVPTEAKVFYRPAGGGLWTPVEGPKKQHQLDLLPGKYDFKADADGYFESQPIITRQVGEKQTTTIHIELAKKPETKAPVVSPFADPNSVTKVDDWYVPADGKSPVQLRPGLTRLSIFFLKDSGRKLFRKHMEWTIEVDKNNKRSYSIDGENVTIAPTVGGRKLSAATVHVNLANDKSEVVVIQLEKQGVKVTSKGGDSVDQFVDASHDWTHARIFVKSSTPFTVLAP